MKDKKTAFERRIEMLLLLIKKRKSSIVELSKVFSVCRKTAYNDIVFLSRYAPIYTKGGANGVVLCQDNGHIKPLFFGKISKMHKVVAFIPRFA